MNHEEIKLLRENFLVEELEKILVPNSLTKQAGYFDSLGGNSAAQWLRDQFQDSSEVPGGYFTSIINLLAPAVAFRINPFLGLFYLALSQIGFDLSGIAVKVAKALKPKIDAQEPISSQEIKSAVDAAAGSAPGASADDGFVTAEESFDFLLKRAYLVKNSVFGFGGSSGKTGFIEKIFGRDLFSTPYGRSKFWHVGKGLVFWMFKNIFLSLGLLAGAAMIFGPKKKDSLKDEETEQAQETSKSEKEPESETKENKSFFGSKKEEPISGLVWTTNLINGSVPATLKAWALHYYPELNQYPDIESRIYSDANFRNVTNFILSDPGGIGTRKVELPEEYVVSKNISELEKKVVDKFITSEFLRKLNATKTQ